MKSNRRTVFLWKVKVPPWIISREVQNIIEMPKVSVTELTTSITACGPHVWLGFPEKFPYGNTKDKPSNHVEQTVARVLKQHTVYKSSLQIDLVATHSQSESCTYMCVHTHTQYFKPTEIPESWVLQLLWFMYSRWLLQIPMEIPSYAQVIGWK